MNPNRRDLPAKLTTLHQQALGDLNLKAGKQNFTELVANRMYESVEADKRTSDQTEHAKMRANNMIE